ncbi:hypothetical protein A5731_28030 [Mycolicibacterium conceptionense]|jgi:hypothetical protein|uniref:Uncharacterized protein n=4 Tax=Mycolicibacterium TaxID=1866885 RepID=A0A0J8TW41_9MYCO|nr:MULTISPECIES: hypothetical protein [Mycolicibacterium]OCB43002.1 hypothetical protein A5721_26115 [Mycolicibacterium vulneris]KLI04058.1 hypothetical protein AA982_32155 [Mycolicibacterium senegalense]KLO50440.1 hypothetical protein ABW05_01835 [Mycolicibacterium senegalense]KMV13643.1 hypothetical protein ACT17_34180 [Mycolicibacterium conceptionense]MCV7200671.1 hypothetical protein [Mycolicibacterium peregrinum]
MTPDIWISTTTSEVTFENNTPGRQWQRVGTIDTAQEADLAKHIQVLLNLRGSAPPISGFYVSADPDNVWVRAAQRDPAGQPPFWIAVDPWGRDRPTIVNAAQTYFVSNEMATATRSLARRAPQPHPGRAVKPVMIGVKIKHHEDGLFTPHVNR